jgi:hypothetical protein
MNARISIKELVEAFEMQDDEIDFFLNPTTGEIRSVTVDDRFLLERSTSPESLPAWQREALPLIRDVLESKDWLQLPHRTDIHRWSIMKRFCETHCGEVRAELMNAIRGRGAFRMFREVLDGRGLRDAWLAFRRSALDETARKWLESYQLHWE